MTRRQLGFLKPLSGLAVAVCSILPASAHYVYDSPAGAAHNLEHLSPAIAFVVLILALGATTVFCVKRK